MKAHRWSHPSSLLLPLLSVLLAAACGDDDGGNQNQNQNQRQPLDPNTAPRALVDRFSPVAGTLFVRDGANGLPGAGDPIDFDAPPFVTQGLSPDGAPVRYYNLDVQPRAPAILYLLYREGEDSPVEGQLPIVDVIPGDPGYSDFWRVYNIIVPADYVANTATSFTGVYDFDPAFKTTGDVVNCAVVPEGISATLRMPQTASPSRLAWYRDQVVTLFTFAEAPITVTPQGDLPVAPIYVCFNVAPDQPGGGPPSGVCAESDGVQTHNVVGAVPGDSRYSPLWSVSVYDASAFESVESLPTAEAATRLVQDMALVNCLIVGVGS